MKAVIMAAGKGTRMLPLTEEVPKVLVEINGKPFLYYLMKNLQRAGYDEFGLIVGYKKEKIVEFLQDYGFQAEMIEQKELLGTGDAVMKVRDFVGYEEFILMAGDHLYDVDDLKKIRTKDGFCYVSAIPVENPQKYGVLIVDQGMLTGIVEKPKNYVGNLVNVSLYKFTSEIFGALEKIKLSERGELELTDAVSILAGESKVKVNELKWWLDLGTIDDIVNVSNFLKNYWFE